MIPGQYFRYSLPPERIAQQPIGRGAERASAQLLIAAKSKGNGAAPPGVTILDSRVERLPQHLRKNDLVVVNNSRVVPSRFFFQHRGGDMEVLLLDPLSSSGTTEALARPMKRAKEGDELQLSAGLIAQVRGRNRQGDRLMLEIRAVTDGASIRELVVQQGLMPIPGYIRHGRAQAEDRDSYQTIFAKCEGSIAAPTAGLHFTPELCDSLRANEIDLAEITLHVGPASFQPVRDADALTVSTEFYSIPEGLEEAIARARSRGGRIVAVGTTTMRALESWARSDERDRETEFAATDLFIKPGFDFQVADLLMTNFHQPETTHLLLVAAFIGEPETEAIYRHALSGSYRFLSYGDAMLLER